MTTDPRTDEIARETEIAKRAEAATPGPWLVGDIVDQEGRTPSDEAIIFDGWSDQDVALEINIKCAAASATAAFIANAPDDIPYLLTALRSERQKAEALEKALGKLRLAYVNLLESGRDRIIALGGTCDPVDVMEAGDPALRAARALLTQSSGAKS